MYKDAKTGKIWNIQSAEKTLQLKTIWRNSQWNYEEEFEDTKGIIRIRKSKKDRQHNGQKKKDKIPNNDLQNIHIK